MADGYFTDAMTVRSADAGSAEAPPPWTLVLRGEEYEPGDRVSIHGVVRKVKEEAEKDGYQPAGKEQRDYILKHKDSPEADKLKHGTCNIFFLYYYNDAKQMYITQRSYIEWDKEKKRFNETLSMQDGSWTKDDRVVTVRAL